jgi:predicted dithiol-disulfide oxidoreductase (DUF899 family)
LSFALRPKNSRPETGTDVATYARERPGMSAFVLEDGVVYHAYSTYARGLDGLWGAYQWLDRAPRGATSRATGGAVTTSTRGERFRGEISRRMSSEPADGVANHTDSCHQRGLEEFNVTYQLLDRVPAAPTKTNYRTPRLGSGARTNEAPVSV